jgi:hypothetical protein
MGKKFKALSAKEKAIRREFQRDKRGRILSREFDLFHYGPPCNVIQIPILATMNVDWLSMILDNFEEVHLCHREYKESMDKILFRQF